MSEILLCKSKGESKFRSRNKTHSYKIPPSKQIVAFASESENMIVVGGMDCN